MGDIDKIKERKMNRVFIAHAWSSDEEYNQKQLQFIWLLQLELEERGLEVKYDDAVSNKDSLNSFMIENIRECNVILAICDEPYFQKSEIKDSGVSFEIKEIREHNLLKKVIPLKISSSQLPYNFQTIQYEAFQEEFEKMDLSISRSMKSLMVRVAELLDNTELLPVDSIKSEILSKIDSLDLIGNILKSNVTLSDIYTYPELRIDGKNSVEYSSAKSLMNKHFYLDKIFIVGDRQSGKSAFAKKIFMDIYHNGKFQPIFLEKQDIDSKNIDKAIKKKYISTYKTVYRNRKDKIVVVVDDFHTLLQRYQDSIKKLDDYAGIILFVDDIYDISSKDFSMSRFTIQPFRPSLRNELIEKLIDSQDSLGSLSVNDRLKKIDESSRLVNISLGLERGYRNGLIPAFPMYILIILGASTELNSRLDSPVSSYGHCYQLLIGLAFQNCGVSNDLIESYMNFLSYFAIYLYENGSDKVSNREFESFLEGYQLDYKIFEVDTYLQLLIKTGLIVKNNSGYYSFSYEYLYYFYLGKHLSENFDERKSDIEKIINNLDIERNGHISIFLAHHCKDKRLIEMLNSLLENTFHDFSESTLSVLELGDFDKQVKELSNNINYKIGNHHEERKTELERQDIIEGEMYSETTEDDREEIIRQNKVRAAIQTVEVIGVILKNRYGSIKNKDFEKILKNTVDSNLRLLNSFIEIVSDKNFINFLENFISQNIKEEDFDGSRLKDEIRDLLIRMNFATIFTLIMKTISSIGSETISRYFSDMLKNHTLTPSYILIKRGLELQYEKRFSEDDILSDLKNKELSHVARTMLNLMVVNHVSRHHYNFQEKARIEKKFGFKPNVILKREQQIKSIES